MPKFRHEVEEVHENLSIFLRTTGKKPVWYAIVKHKGKEISVSTGKHEREKPLAINSAKAIYRELIERLETGRSTYRFTFEDSAVSFLDEFTGKPKAFKDAERALLHHLIPAFGNKDIAKFSDLDIAHYQAKRAKQGLKGSTFNNEMSILRQVFKFAVPGYMDRSKIPYIQNIPLNGQADRAAFETHEIRQILLYIWRKRNRLSKRKGAYGSWFNFYAYVMLLVATGARPISLRNVRVGSVQPYKGGYTILMESAKGYGKSGKVIPQRWVNRVIRQLLQHHKDGGSKPNDYLFRQHSSDYYLKEFEKVIVKMGIKYSPVGESRSIYSVRHHYITSMVIKGVPMEVTAKNTLTSIQMIAKHYDKSDSLRFFDQLH